MSNAAAKETRAFVAKFKVNSDKVTYSEDAITAKYSYSHTVVDTAADGSVSATPKEQNFEFRTISTVPRVGVMLVGLGGNNGSTLTAGVLANRQSLSWRTKTGEQTANYWGSISQASTVLLGNDRDGREVFAPLKSFLPMLDPNDLVIGGWDISGANMYAAVVRAQVYEPELQEKLRPLLEGIKPLPAPYYPDFIASNQADRADNTLPGTKAEHVEIIREDIRAFKASNNLDSVVVLWTANTERFSSIVPGINTTADELLAAVQNNEEEVSPSTVFAIASILEGCTYINGSPQNTFVPGCLELAERHGTLLAGDDFKTGQTKVKSVLTDFLVSAGIKPVSIVSYNHLGNNDGKNLDAPAQFRSKEISKTNVVDDMVASNPLLYGKDEHPDHCIVIKYVPYVGDSKRAMDEYTSEMFMGGKSTIVMHNTCEDSLLAAPLILDLVILSELCQRITYRTDPAAEFENFHSVLSILSYLIKAPLAIPGTPVVNSLFRQRACIENVLRACIGLQPNNQMRLGVMCPKFNPAL